MKPHALAGRAGLGRMVKLAMTASSTSKFPTFLLQSLDDVPDFQSASALTVRVEKYVRNVGPTVLVDDLDAGLKASSTFSSSSASFPSSACTESVLAFSFRRRGT